MCRLPFQAQISVTLSTQTYLCINITRLLLGNQSMLSIPINLVKEFSPMALKIVYPICCGIDVHKTFVVACIASTVKGVTTYKRHRFSTYTKGLLDLSQYRIGNSSSILPVSARRNYYT